MNCCGIQQNEMRGLLVCPKPRRVGQLCAAPDPIRSLRWQSCHQVDPLDLKAGVELLDIFLTKEHPVDTTPPFFIGSPPTRSANPLIHDARFGEVAQVTEPVQTSNPILLSSPIPVSARTGFARTKFGFAPAPVRIEGFDCLDRERSRNRGIPAVA